MEHNTDRILWTVLVLAIGVALFVIFKPAANGLLGQTTEKTQTIVSGVYNNPNLIVQSDLKNGYIDANNGKVVSTSVDFNSDYVATNGETVFTFSSPDYVFKGNYGGCDRIAMYDSNKNYLGSQYITSATQTLTKSNVAYIRFCINSAGEGNTTGKSSDWLANHRYKLEKGSLATPYNS